jgi:hypothetical protein
LEELKKAGDETRQKMVNAAMAKYGTDFIKQNFPNVPSVANGTAAQDKPRERKVLKDFKYDMQDKTYK